jgi:hypothetical protein
MTLFGRPRPTLSANISPTWENIMRLPTRHWLDYDSVALTVLMTAISILELLVFCI